MIGDTLIPDLEIRSIPMRHRRSISNALLLGTVVVTWMPLRATAAAPVETVLYSFTGGTDGANPQSPLIRDESGALYGTTPYGGDLSCVYLPIPGCGTVFKLTPPATGKNGWTESVIHAFSLDASYPESGLTFRHDRDRFLPRGPDALYGTTAFGGVSSAGASDLGTVFELAPPKSGQAAWTETVLQSYAGTVDRSFPRGALISDEFGALYGTTEQGGAAQIGLVFKLMPPRHGETAWTSTVLHTFAGEDGTAPEGALVLDPCGALYGVVLTGGSGGAGAVFKLSPPERGGTVWTKSELFAFTTTDQVGYDPVAGLVMDEHGALYGTTLLGGDLGCAYGSGCGAAFKLTPPGPRQTSWTATLLHAFTGGEGSSTDDGAAPYAPLVRDRTGALYGTTFTGGTGQAGTVYKLSPPARGHSAWTETILHNFSLDTRDGAYPVTGLILDRSGTLYGTTGGGGAYGNGTVYEVKPDRDAADEAVAESAESVEGMPTDDRSCRREEHHCDAPYCTADFPQ
jgi:uncharacterized repeat protein (TIGR03803 family)